jgi:FkbM family methyltransferase
LVRKKNNGYVLSNYLVWLKERLNDKTFIYCCDGYGNELEKFLTLIKTPTVFIDIGANLGLFSLIAEKNTKIRKIVAFEPDPLTFEYLENNIGFNGAKKIRAVEAAVSGKSSNITLERVPGHSGMNHIVDASKESVNCINVMSVDKGYFDLLYDSDDQCEFFIKIDVEGLELEVLTTLFDSKISPFITSIFVEITNLGSNKQEVEDLLFNNGFQLNFRTHYQTYFDALWTRRFIN